MPPLIRKKNWASFSWLLPVSAQEENPGFPVCLKTPVQVFRHVHQVMGSRGSQAVIFDHAEKRRRKVSVYWDYCKGKCRKVLFSDKRWPTLPCWDLQCPLGNWCEPVSENTCHIADTRKSWSVARQFLPSQKLLQEWRGLLYTNCKRCTLLMISYSMNCLWRDCKTVSSSPLVLERVLWLPLPLKYEQKQCLSFSDQGIWQYATSMLSVQLSSKYANLCWDLDPYGGSSLDPWVTWQQRHWLTKASFMCRREKLLKCCHSGFRLRPTFLLTDTLSE